MMIMYMKESRLKLLKVIEIISSKLKFLKEVNISSKLSKRQELNMVMKINILTQKLNVQ